MNLVQVQQNRSRKNGYVELLCFDYSHYSNFYISSVLCVLIGQKRRTL